MKKKVKERKKGKEENEREIRKVQILKERKSDRQQNETIKVSCEWNDRTARKNKLKKKDEKRVKW